MNNIITFLPDPGPWPIVTPRSVLNGGSTSSIDLQSTFAAENAPKRIIYGQVRIGPLVVTTLPYLAGAVIFCYWGYGECDSVVSYTIDDKTPPVGCTAAHYMGTQTQIVDPLLVLAFSANGIAFTDALLGECYSVFYVPSTATPGFPRFNVVLKGLKVYDSRLDSTNGGTGSQRLATPTTWAWSDTPALCHANFLTNTIYGAGKTMLWSSVASVANDNEALVGGTEKHRTLNLCIDKVQRTQDWIDTLQTYAGCWTMTSGDDMKLVSDKAGSSVATLTHADGDIREIKNLRLRGSQGVPSAVIVYYTDTSTIPYTDKSAVATDGTGDKRYSTVYLLGINRYSQAMREAIERLNKLRLSDLSFDLGTFAEHGALEPGEIITVTWPAIGLTSKLVRIGNAGGSYGHPDFQCTEYDPLFYDSSVAAAPTYPDTNLPDPLGTLAPPSVLVIDEELYETRDYSYASRLAISWTAASDFYPIRYFVTISDATHIVNSGYTLDTAYTFGPLEDGVTYTVNVYAERESTQVRSIALTDTQVAAGNTGVPDNVANFALIPTDTGSRLTWDPVTNVDLAGYFAQATAIWNPALPVVTSKVQFIDLDPLAATTYGFSIKAVNFSGNVSATAGTLTYVATIPATPTLVGNAYFNAVVLSWDDCRTTNPLTHCTVEVTKDGVALADRAVYGNLRTVTYFETASGSYAYRVRAHDYYVPGTFSNTVTLAVVAGSPVDLTDAASDTTMWLVLAGASSGAQSLHTDGALIYNADTNTLTLPELVANSLTINLGGTTLAHLTVNDDPIFVGSTGFNAAGELARVKIGDANYGVGSKYGTGISIYVPKTAGGSAYNTDSIDAISIAATTGAVTLVSTLETTGVATLNGIYIGQADAIGTITGEPGGTGLRFKARAGNQYDLVVATSGGVGIGLLDPGAYKLNVLGNSLFTGTMGVTGAFETGPITQTDPGSSGAPITIPVTATMARYILWQKGVTAAATVSYENGTGVGTGLVISTQLNESLILQTNGNNPRLTISGAGAITIPGTLGVTGAVTLSSTLSAPGNYFGGNTANALATGSGFARFGDIAGNNVIIDYNSIQGRNNGAALTLTLNPLGGAVVTPGAVVAAGGFSGTMTAAKATDTLQTLTGSVVPAGGLGTNAGLFFNKQELNISNFASGDTTNQYNGFAQMTKITGTHGGSGFASYYNKLEMASNTDATNGMFVAIVGQAVGTVSVTRNQSLYGGNFYGNIAASCTGWNNVSGAEINTDCQSVVAYKTGIQIVSQSNDIARGTVEAAISIGAVTPSGGTNGYKVGLVFGDYHGSYPITTTGTLIKTVGSHTVDTGLDLSSYTFTSYVINSPGIQVTGAGAVNAASYGATTNYTARVGVAPATGGSGFNMGTTGIGVYFGSGSPNGAVTAPHGSIYLRTDGGGTNDRLWVNTDAGTTWTYIATGA